MGWTGSDWLTYFEQVTLIKAQQLGAIALSSLEASSDLSASLTPQCISRISKIMNTSIKSSSFKSGNSVALRLPKALGVGPGEQFDIVRRGMVIEVRPAVDVAKEKAELSELIRILRELGPTKTMVLRENIEFPDRPGLY